MLNFNIPYKPQSIWWCGIAHSDPRQPLCEANCPNATDDDEGDDDLKQLLYECDQLPKVPSSVPSKASSVPSCVQAHFSRLLYKSLLPCPRHIWTLCKFSALCPGSLARASCCNIERTEWILKSLHCSKIHVEGVSGIFLRN